MHCNSNHAHVITHKRSNLFHSPVSLNASLARVPKVTPSKKSSIRQWCLCVCVMYVAVRLVAGSRHHAGAHVLHEDAATVVPVPASEDFDSASQHQWTDWSSVLVTSVSSPHLSLKPSAPRYILRMLFCRKCWQLLFLRAFWIQTVVYEWHI